jgi:hypothetical protein
MNAPFPKITSIGRPPELHADRVVAAMLRQIVKHRHKISDSIAAMKKDIGVRDGNPKAQHKMVERLHRAAWPFVVTARLEPGKRGRYSLTLYTMEVWDPATDTIIGEDDRIPDAPWLAFTQMEFIHRGRGRPVEKNGGFLLFLTHHALSRLAQRSGARTIEDVAMSARMIGYSYVIDDTAAVTDGFRDGDTFKVKLPNGLGTAICPMVKYKDGKGGIVVPTLWNEGEKPEAST